jgi:FtsZ-binding cell division protein ZapB
MAIIIATLTSNIHMAAETIESLQQRRDVLKAQIVSLVNEKHAAHKTIQDANAKIETILQKRHDLRNQIRVLRGEQPVRTTTTAHKVARTQRPAKNKTTISKKVKSVRPRTTSTAHKKKIVKTAKKSTK